MENFNVGKILIRLKNSHLVKPQGQQNQPGAEQFAKDVGKINLPQENTQGNVQQGGTQQGGQQSQVQGQQGQTNQGQNNQGQIGGNAQNNQNQVQQQQGGQHANAPANTQETGLQQQIQQSTNQQ